MQERLGGAHIGTLLDQLGREAKRQFLRQGQVGQLDNWNLTLGWEPSEQKRKLIADLLELPLQRRYARLRLRQLRLLGQDVTARDGAKLELLVQKVKLLTLGGNNVLLPLKLRPQRGLSDCRDDDVRDQRKVGCLELEERVFLRRPGSFQAPTQASERVDRIGDIDRCGEKLQCLRVVERAL